MKLALLSVVVLFVIMSLNAQPKMFDAPLSPRLANYEIEVRLDPATKKLYGSEILTWTNKSGNYIPDLQFHLYLNAFKNEQTTFMKESGGRHRNSALERNGGWGWTNIKKMSIGQNTVVTDSIRFARYRAT